MAVTDIELDVELLKKEVSDMKQIHGRLVKKKYQT